MTRSLTALTLLVVLVVLVLSAAPPSSAEALDDELNRAIALIGAGDLEQAGATLDAVIRRLTRGSGQSPELAEAYLYLGVTHAMLNSEVTARGAFREALRLNPALNLSSDRFPPKVLRAFAAARGSTPAAASKAAGATPSTDGRVQNFTRLVQSAIDAGDTTFLEKVIDVNALCARAIRGNRLDERIESEFRLAVARDLRDASKVLIDEVRKGGTYTLLRTRTSPTGDPTVIFRLTSSEQGLNYQEFLLTAESVGAADLWAYTSGEWLSDSHRRTWLSLAAEFGMTRRLQGLAGVESDFVKAAPLRAQIQELQVAGRHREALAILDSLPASLRSERSTFLSRLQSAQRVSEKEYADTLSRLPKNLQNDPGFALIRVDYHVQRGEYDHAIEALTSLETAVGGDHLISSRKAQIMLQKGDLAGARRAATLARVAEPSLVEARITLALVTLREKSYSEALPLIEGLMNDSVITMETVETHATYTDLRSSPEYRRWREERGTGGVSGGVPGGMVGGVVGGLPAAPGPPPDGPIRVGGAIKEPRKLKNVAPVYPPIALAARVQGLVILETTISPEGRVTDVKVKRSIPLLDQAAIDAVQQWVYTPTLLNGVPVPVIVTATVNFSLNDARPQATPPPLAPVAPSPAADDRPALRALRLIPSENTYARDITVEDQKSLIDEIEGGMRGARGFLLIEPLMTGTATERAMQHSGVLELRDRFAALNKSVDDVVAADTARFQQKMREGTFRFLRVMEAGARPVLLFGFSGNEGGIDYLLVRTQIAHDTYFATDYFWSSGGEWLSDNLARTWRRAAMGQGMAVSLHNGEDWTRSRGAFDQIDKDIAEGRFKAALDVMTNLPDSLRAERSLALQRLQIAQNLGANELKAAADHFSRLFPDDLALLTTLGGAYFTRGDYDLALGVVEDLRRVVGGDAALHDLRARILGTRRDFAGAKQAARAALREEPTLRAAYHTLLDISLAETDFEETGRLLTYIEKTYNQPLTGLETAPRFSNFVKSEAYRRWRQSR